MKPLILFIVLLFSFVPQSLEKQNNIDGYYENDRFVVIRIDPTVSHIAMCYKNNDGEVIGNFGRLFKHVKSTGHDLVFACNGGMFMTDLRPLGLYVEDGKQIASLNTRDASTNFYIKPNGVFCVMDDGTAQVIPTGIMPTGIRYATQSGPMLTVNGEINEKFSPESTSNKIRNGVGVQDDGKVVFVLSKEMVNFYNFATVFQNLGCKNSLFLDGDISDFYCPEVNWVWPNGYMSVMITVVK